MSLGLTQKQLADKCAEEGVEVSDVALSAHERGLWAPRPELHPVLCKILDLPGDFDFVASARAADVPERAAS